MIPIRLTIEGFLAFRKRTVIDFEKINDDGLFLISGPTGSGKTSIFDAMVYALYGKASTTDRNDPSVQLRSALLPEEDNIFVEYIFSVGNKTYIARRFTTGKKTKNNKQEFFEEGHEENAITKVSEINAEVEHVLGLTLEQFKKIVLLPQGEFRNFLMSSTKEKSEILRNIFETQELNRIKDAIKLRKDSLEERKQKADEIIETEKIISQKASELIHPQEILEALRLEIQETDNELENIKKLRNETQDKLNDKKIKLEHFIEGNEALRKLEEAKKDLEAIRLRDKEIEADKKRSELIRLINPVIRIFEDREILKTKDQRLNDNLKVITERKNDIGEKLDSATSEYNENPKRQQNAEEKRNRIRVLKEKLNDVSELKTLRKKLEDAFRTFENLKKKSEKIKGIRDLDLKLNDEIGNLREEQSVLNQKKLDLRDILEKSDKKKAGLENLIRIKTKIKETETSIETLKKVIFQKEEELKKAQSEEERLKHEFELQGLSKYAHLVHIGEICPLCGSKVTEVHNIISEHGITSEDVENSSRAVSLLRGELSKLSERNSNFENIFKELNDELKETGEAEGNYEDPEAELESVRKSISEIERELKDTDKSLSDILDKTDTALRKHKDNQKILKESENIEKDTDEAKERYLEISGAEKALNERAGTSDENELRKETDLLNREVQILTEKIRESEKAYLELQKNMQDLNTREELLIKEKETTSEELTVKTDLFDSELLKRDVSFDEFLELKEDSIRLDEILKKVSEFEKTKVIKLQNLKNMEENARGKTFTDIEKFKEEIKNEELKFTELNSENEKVILKKDRYSNAESRIRNAVAETDAIIDDLDTARKFFSLTNRGISFENYVLGYYLDGVLRRANTRLKDMTAGRYHLVRKTDEKVKMNKTQGLDLNVFDSFSNSQRDVKTLSGGESFKAALSLALGLSDFILEKRSGIRIDSIFIDEGFGTLDQESLDSALEMIRDLRAGGRIVGIISHVEELKERISSRFIVESNGSEGSSVTFKKQFSD